MGFKPKDNTGNRIMQQQEVVFSQEQFVEDVFNDDYILEESWGQVLDSLAFMETKYNIIRKSDMVQYKEYFTFISNKLKNRQAANCRPCSNVVLLRSSFGVPLALLSYGMFSIGHMCNESSFTLPWRENVGAKEPTLKWIRKAFEEGSNLMRKVYAINGYKYICLRNRLSYFANLCSGGNEHGWSNEVGFLLN